MTDFERAHEQVLREVYADLEPRLKRASKPRDQAMAGVAVKAALTRAIALGIQAGEAMEAERLNKKWRVAVEQATGQDVDLEYQPPAPIEVPDVREALYGSTTQVA